MYSRKELFYQRWLAVGSQYLANDGLRLVASSKATFTGGLRCLWPSKARYLAYILLPFQGFECVIETDHEISGWLGCRRVVQDVAGAINTRDRSRYHYIGKESRRTRKKLSSSSWASIWNK